MLTADESLRYRAFVERYQRMVYPLFAARLRLITGRPLGRVLDLGCGPGYLTHELAQMAGSVDALDINPAMVELTREFVAAATCELAPIRYELGDVHALPYEDHRFDLIVSYSCFHHWAEPVQGLRECRRVCARDGYVVLLDTDRAAGELVPKLRTMTPEPELFRFVEEAFDESYTRPEVERFVVEAELQIESLKPFKFEPGDALEAMDFDPLCLDLPSAPAPPEISDAATSWLLVARPETA